MKFIDICTNCYAHLVGSTIYLYVDNQFTEMLHVDNIEMLENPLEHIVREIELSSRPSLYKCLQLID